MTKPKTQPTPTLDIRELAGGSIFYVEFIKRSTGELRKMRCRLGVEKNLTGKGMNYDPAKHDLLCVYDLDKEAYRMIALESIQRITIRGETFVLPVREGD